LERKTTHANRRFNAVTLRRFNVLKFTHLATLARKARKQKSKSEILQPDKNGERPFYWAFGLLRKEVRLGLGEPL